jgi:hypothetical protein
MAAPSLRSLAARLAAVEARLSDIEGPYADSLYQLRRASIRNDLRMGRLLDRLGVEDVPDDEVDAVLDDEA